MVLTVARREDGTKPWARRLASGYAHPEVRAFVETAFGDAIIPGAWSAIAEGVITGSAKHAIERRPGACSVSAGERITP